MSGRCVSVDLPFGGVAAVMNATPKRRRMTVLLVAIALFMLPAQAAFAWTVPGTGGANSFAALLSANEAPVASVTSGTATVSWNAVTFTGSSTAATGYTVNRVWRSEDPGPGGLENGDKEAAQGSCAGVVTALSCTSQQVVGETWSYTITPLYAGWIGTESEESVPVTQAPAPEVMAITQSNGNGTVESGDTFAITFSQVLDPKSICSTFTSDPSATQIATGLTLTFTGNPNVISITNDGTCGTNGVGTLQVGASGGGRYTPTGPPSNSFTITNTTLTWDPTSKTITVTFGTIVGATTTGNAATAVYTPGALTGGGLPLVGGPTYNSATDQRF
jgi:hypothetical protein